MKTVIRKFSTILTIFTIVLSFASCMTGKELTLRNEINPANAPEHTFNFDETKSFFKGPEETVSGNTDPESGVIIKNNVVLRDNPPIWDIEKYRESGPSVQWWISYTERAGNDWTEYHTCWRDVYFRFMRELDIYNNTDLTFYPQSYSDRYASVVDSMFATSEDEITFDILVFDKTLRCPEGFYENAIHFESDDAEIVSVVVSNPATNEAEKEFDLGYTLDARIITVTFAPKKDIEDYSLGSIKMTVDSTERIDGTGNLVDYNNIDSILLFMPAEGVYYCMPDSYEEDFRDVFPEYAKRNPVPDRANPRPSARIWYGIDKLANAAISHSMSLADFKVSGKGSSVKVSWEADQDGKRYDLVKYRVTIYRSDDEYLPIYTSPETSETSIVLSNINLESMWIDAINSGETLYIAIEVNYNTASDTSWYGSLLFNYTPVGCETTAA